MSDPTVETTVYLTLEPTYSQVYPEHVNGMKVTSMTKTRPKVTRGPVVELRLRLPAAAFAPLRPLVTIDVPPEALDFEPTVTVQGITPAEAES